MRHLHTVKRVLIPLFVNCLLGASLLSCGVGSGSNPCGSFRPATVTITGVAGTTYACGAVVTTSNANFVSVVLFDANISNTASIGMGVGAAPGSYPTIAANEGKIQFNFATSQQTGFCTAPSGTIDVTSYTSPGPLNDAQLGRIEGTFTKVTLCTSGGALSATVSGTFKIE